MSVKFRNAERKDTGLILQFIRELAKYEKMLDDVVADEATLEEWIFDKEKAENQRVVGAAAVYEYVFNAGFCAGSSTRQAIQRD